MDNITHGLIGVVLAKAVSRKKDAGFARAAVWTAVIGSNLPDFDFIQSALEGGGKLAYLLYHRGHTHTLWFTLPGAVISALLGTRLGKIHPSRWPELFLLGWVACLFHIAADFGNNYGVHPFAPFMNSWFYGDSIFIIEPLIWFALLPLVFTEALALYSKIVSVVLGVAMLGLIWIGPFMPWQFAAGITAYALAVAALQYRVRGIGVGVAAALLVIGGFVLQSARAKGVIRERLQAQAPHEQVRQLAITPAPGNPWCWEALVVTQAGDDRYLARSGTLSLAPGWVDPERCFLRVRNVESGTAPLGEATLASGSDLHWRGEFSGSIKVAKKMREQSCAFSQLLSFARVPYWSEQNPRAVGDLRFDREPGLGFAELDPQDSSPCIKSVPPWSPPSSL